MRRTLVAGNWKMNGSQSMAAALCADILRGMAPGGDVEVVVCPPHILIPAAVAALPFEPSGSAPVSVGAQDLDVNENGAFTGQTSASMLVDGGCRYVIVGHSERRAEYHETDALVARKFKAALAAGLRPIVCVGETQAQRAAGATEKVVGQQLDALLDARLATAGAAAGAEISGVVIAYEPVWAIGTGLTATPEQAQQVHRFIRDRLATRDARAADECRILYGGSMKPQNAAELIAQEDIDGGLIGGAALNATDFLAICKAAASAQRSRTT